MSAAAPIVSVIVPTFNRPEMVTKAVASALRQSVRDIEVIVIVDGLDRGTVEALGAIEDPRLRALVPDRSLGNADARNFGIRAARAAWIALLDDDDLWFPDKLALQIEAAGRARGSPIVSCRFVARADDAEFIWPRRLPSVGQPIGDYLFRRRFPTTGDGVVQTSTILARAELFGRCPFDARYRRFVDQDWLLRAASLEGVELVFAAGEHPQSVWCIDDRPRVTTEPDWREDIDWVRAHRDLLSPEAYAAFVLTLPSLRAARSGDLSACHLLLREAFSNGSPHWAELVFHGGNFLLPSRARSWLAQATRPFAQRRAFGTGRRAEPGAGDADVTVRT